MIFILLLLTFFSCKEQEPDLISTESINLYVISGNNQSVLADNFLPNPVVVKLSSSSGYALPNKIVNMAVTDGGGSVKNSSDTTDEKGLIEIEWKLGYETGPQELKASSQGVDELTIKAFAEAKPGVIKTVSGNNQKAFTGDTLLTPIVLAVTDSAGNPIENRLVKGDIVNGGGKLIPINEFTDLNGEAKFTWVIGSEIGEHQVKFLAGTESPAEAAASVSKGPTDKEIVIFSNTRIEYPNSQTVSANVTLPDVQYYKIEAVLELTSPCNSCSDPECDPWDRIGFVNIDAKTPGGGTIQLELIRFITPFGNSNTYVQDVSQFAPLLTGNVKFNAYISTFIGHWNVTFKLRFKKATLNNSYFMVSPVIFDNAMFAYEEVKALDVIIPENNQVILTYFTTGHNNQGRNCDEFCEKVNRIYVDNKLVYEFVPWQTNCEDFAAVNKCEGSQTLSFDRAGWCPGDIVRPTIINVGKLSPGEHVFKIHVVNIEDNGGYWRTSLSVVAKK